jgi:hypothetical protein
MGWLSQTSCFSFQYMFWVSAKGDPLITLKSSREYFSKDISRTAIYLFIYLVGVGGGGLHFDIMNIYFHCLEQTD